MKFDFKLKGNSAWTGHMDFAYNHVREHKPKYIVELGTMWGHSFFTMAQAVKDGGYKAKLIAIDNWVGDKHVGEYGDDVFYQVRDTAEQYFPDIKVQLIRKNFDEARGLVQNKIDLLHIDGSHDYDSVRNDVDNWIPKVVDGGWIFMHDVEVPHFGVNKVFQELKNEHPDWEFSVNPGSFGLGIIRKNG